VKELFAAIAMLCSERDIDIGRSGVLTTLRSRYRMFLRFKWNCDRLGFDVVQFFPEDLEF
jgi:hypothetical protein